MAGKPKLEANNISVLLNHVLGKDRFPVDVEKVAREYSENKFPDQKISEVLGADLPGFEGMLVRHPKKNRWKIIYNNSQPSQGRIRFTLAHEFGHYILHRHLQQKFSCTKTDVNESDAVQYKSMESEADIFSSTLLMPLDDFRIQARNQCPSIELIQHLSNRYGVSMMAAALRWKEIAKDRVVVVAVRDGHLLWAVSNKSAYKSGAYLQTAQKVIPVPEGSLLDSCIWTPSGESKKQKANLWFPKEPPDMPLVEHVYVAQEQFDYSLGLLIMPEAEVRAKKEVQESLILEPLSGKPRL